MKLALALLALPLGSLVAQSPTLDHDLRSAGWVEVLRPSFSTYGGSSVSSFIVTAGLRAPISNAVSVVLEAPFVTTSTDDQFGGGSTSGSAIGNPFVGLRLQVNPTTTMDIGGRIPLATDGTGGQSDAQLAAMLGDFDRFEAYGPNIATLHAGLRTTARSPLGVFARVMAGASFIMPVHTSGATNQTFLNYGLFGGFASGRLELQAGFTGRANLTNGGSFDDATVHQITLAFTCFCGTVRPTLSIRAPMDKELDDVLNYTIQLGAVIQLSR